jgi:hypothetical protein
MSNNKVNSHHLVIGHYFFKKFVNPENQIYLPKDDYNIIKKLYTTSRYKPYHVKILHDGLSKEFIQKYSRKNFKFVYLDSKKFSYCGKDIILCHALDYLKEHPEITRVFLLNCINVKIVGQIFELIDDEKYYDHLFIGSERKMLLDNSWFFKKINALGKQVDKQNLTNWPTLNTDILGGHSTKIIEFLEKMVPFLEELHTLFKKYNGGAYSIRHNAIAVNYLAFLEDNIITGHPLHTTTKNHLLHGGAEGHLMFTYN